jgi:hypothetical protein
VGGPTTVISAGGPPLWFLWGAHHCDFCEGPTTVISHPSCPKNLTIPLPNFATAQKYFVVEQRPFGFLNFVKHKSWTLNPHLSLYLNKRDHRLVLLSVTKPGWYHLWPFIGPPKKYNNMSAQLMTTSFLIYVTLSRFESQATLKSMNCGKIYIFNYLYIQLF